VDKEKRVSFVPINYERASKIYEAEKTIKDPLKSIEKV
jgi:hypothetical protein